MIEFKTTVRFKKEFKALKKKYRSITQDYQNLLDELTTNPYQGIDLGNGFRKIRMAISDKGKGKSHGARVITYTDAIISISEGTLVLLYIYDKSDRDNISDNELQALLDSVNE